MVLTEIRQSFLRFFRTLLGILCLSAILTFIISMAIYYAMITTLPGAYAAFHLPEVVVEPLKKGEKHRIFTLEALKKYNGKQRKRLLVAVRGVVFDVTKKDGKKSEEFSPGEPWNYMTGHDITRATARRSYDPKYFDNLSEEFLADDEKQTLDTEFRDNYMKHYKVYGYMDYFYRENTDQFEEDDDALIDQEVRVSQIPYFKPEPIDPAEAEKSAKEAKAAEEKIDKQLAERWAKYEQEHGKDSEL